jgi:hypothetical protein
MLKHLALAMLATACISGAARAETWEVPRPYAIPLPPLSEPRWEVGLRYWWSEGSTSFRHQFACRGSVTRQSDFEPHL